MTSFLTKVAQIFDYFCAILKNVTLKLKLLRLILGNLWKNWATFNSGHAASKVGGRTRSQVKLKR